MGRGDYFTATTESRSGAHHLRFLLSGKRRLLLFGGTEAKREGGSEGMHQIAREWRMLLLPLKVSSFGGERAPRSFSAHTHTHHAHASNRSSIIGSGRSNKSNSVNNINIYSSNI